MKKKSLKEGARAWGIVTPRKVNNISLTKLAKEAWEPTRQEETTMSPEDKKKFMEAISNFSSLNNSIYREQSLQEITAKLKEIVEAASHITVTETEDWFDRVTVQRHMKQLGESYKTFEKTAKQISELQQRLEACYEDIGTGLNKYYNISPSVNEGADYQKFFVDAMKKFNVKSPADFKDAKKKQEFFDFVDANYKGKHE
jgi:hypothetical protein